VHENATLCDFAAFAEIIYILDYFILVDGRLFL
jgi:hypothetical protein